MGVKRKGKLHKLTDRYLLDMQLFKMSPNLSTLSISGVLGIKKGQARNSRGLSSGMRTSWGDVLGPQIYYQHPTAETVGASGIYSAHSTKSLIKVLYRRVGYQKQIMTMHNNIRDLLSYPELLRQLCHLALLGDMIQVRPYSSMYPRGTHLPNRHSSLL